MTDFVFKGKVRNDMGKGASRRLRREGNIPAIVYGAGEEAVSIVLNHNEVLKCFRHNDIYTSVVTVKIDGKGESAILRDVQRHPYKPLITHLDFLRIRADEVIVVEIPVEIINESKAVGVVAGGVVTVHMSTVTISCLPKYLPNTIQIDISNLELGQNLMLSEIATVPNVNFVSLMNEEEINDQPVVSIIAPRVAEEVTVTEEATSEEVKSDKDSE